MKYFQVTALYQDAEIAYGEGASESEARRAARSDIGRMYRDRTGEIVPEVTYSVVVTNDE